MKKLSLIIFAVLMAFAMIPVSAATGGDVLNGTPTVDGNLDAMYKESAGIELENIAFYKNGTTTASTGAAGTKTYMLWDKQYLYLCTVVNDKTTTAKVDSAVDYTNWATADNIEHYIRSEDGTKGGQLHIAALGTGLKTDNEGIGDIKKVVCASTVTDTGYITEIAVPLSVVELKAGSKFGYSLQYNDFIPADGATIASGLQAKDKIVTMTLSDKTVTAVETKAPAATADSAKTADLVPAAVTVMSAAVFGVYFTAKGKKSK